MAQANGWRFLCPYSVGKAITAYGSIVHRKNRRTFDVPTGKLSKAVKEVAALQKDNLPGGLMAYVSNYVTVLSNALKFTELGGKVSLVQTSETDPTTVTIAVVH